MFVPSDLTVPKLQTAEDLQGDALLHYDAEMELMNLILLSILNEIYNSVDACTTAKEMLKRVELDSFDDLFDYLQQFKKLVNASRAKKLEKSHDPLVLQDDVQTNSEDPLASTMLVNIQSRNSGNTGRNTRRAYVQEEVVEGSNAQNETGNVQRTLRTSSSENTSTDSKYFMEQMLLAKQDEAGVILIDEQSDFLFADASRMKEIEELSANIFLMARIQSANNTSDAGPSYDSAFISEVQSSSINENKEQIGSVEKDTHVPDLYALEQLARNAYLEAEKQKLFAQKVQQQNTTLTNQLELYKERVRVLENINGDNNYLNEFLEADRKAKHFNQQAQSQFINDRDIIRDLEKQRDKLDLAVNDYKQKNEELQKNHLILKRQMRIVIMTIF
ncbi:hypothetical protein Tco_0871237 [Tanacetum coccineum]